VLVVSAVSLITARCQPSRTFECRILLLAVGTSVTLYIFVVVAAFCAKVSADLLFFVCSVSHVVFLLEHLRLWGTEGAKGSLVIQRLASSATGILGHAIETLHIYMLGSVIAHNIPGFQAASWRKLMSYMTHEGHLYLFADLAMLNWYLTGQQGIEATLLPGRRCRSQSTATMS